jgi:GT2 family glycosyltransferase
MLIKCLNAITSTVALDRTQILVQDDATPEHDLRELVVGDRISVDRNDTNLGFAGNCNKASERATGDYLVFVNQDIVPLVIGWADVMMVLFVTSPICGIVCPKLVFPNGGGIQSCGGLFDVNRNPFHRYLGWKNADDRRLNVVENVSWATGACMMISRTDFQEMGGFDTRYKKGYWEDVDLCLRMRIQKRKQVVYQPAALLEHSVGSSGGGDIKTFRQNGLLFHREWDQHIVPDVNMAMVDF